MNRSLYILVSTLLLDIKIVNIITKVSTLINLESSQIGKETCVRSVFGCSHNMAASEKWKEGNGVCVMLTAVVEITKISPRAVYAVVVSRSVKQLMLSTQIFYF